MWDWMQGEKSRTYDFSGRIPIVRINKRSPEPDSIRFLRKVTEQFSRKNMVPVPMEICRVSVLCKCRVRMTLKSKSDVPGNVMNAIS